MKDGTRETREGWAVAPAELNGDSKSTNERGPSLVYSLRLSCRFALAALVGQEQNIFFLSVHFFSSFVPIVQQPVLEFLNNLWGLGTR
jgi:hypothetical protein